MRTKNVLLNIITGVFSKLITLLFSIILPKLIIEYFGSDVNGLVSSIGGIFIYLNLLEAGVGEASIQALYSQVALKNQDKINGIISATSVYYKKTGVYYLACISFMAFLYPVLINNPMSYIDVVIIIFVSSCPNLISYFFQGKYNVLISADNKSYIATMFNTSLSIAVNITKIILILNGKGIILVLSSAAILNVVNTIIFIFYIRKRYYRLNLFVKADFESISKKNDVLAFQIFSLIIHNTDILILTFFCNFKVVSIYTIYYMIINQLLNIPHTYATSIKSGLAQVFYIDFNRFKKLFNFYETYYFVINFTIFTTAYILLTPFIELYTSGITDVVYVDKWLPLLFTVIPILEGIRLPLGDVFCLAGHYKQLKNYALIEALINLFLSIILVNYLSIYGVLIATTISMLFLTIKIISYVSKKLLYRSSAITLYRWTICFGIAIGLVTIYKKLSITIYNYHDFLIIGGLCFIFIGIIYSVIITLIEKEARLVLFEYGNRIFCKIKNMFSF